MLDAYLHAVQLGMEDDDNQLDVMMAQVQISAQQSLRVDLAGSYIVYADVLN